MSQLPGIVKVQLAFQGGGAKIAALLAAAEVVQKLEDKGAIKVTRVAGTSAGAIVAAFLAAELPIKDVRTRLANDVGKKLVAEFPGKTKAGALWDAMWGKRFWNDKPLARWLEGEFKAIQKFKDLKKDLFVYSANLEAGGAEVKVQHDLITALLESAGLPFCFRTWRTQGNTLTVDGGLCLNLPVEDLMSDLSYGQVLAFSFPSSRPGRPETFLTFCMSLLDVAMSHSVEAARRHVGSDAVCTLDIPKELTTFDFPMALDYLRSTQYGDLKEAVEEWFAQFIARANSKSSVYFDHDIWSKPEAGDLKSEMRKVGRIYANVSKHQKLRYKMVRLKVMGNCLFHKGEVGKADEVVYDLEFEPLGDPLIAHHLTFSTPQNSAFFGQYSLKCVNASTKEQIPFEALASTSPDSSIAREMIVFFSPMLKAGTGQYRLSLQDQGKDLLSGLLEPGKRTDYLEIDLRYKEEKVALVQFAIFVPKDLGELSVKCDEVAGTKLSDQELEAAFGTPALGVRGFGWQGRDVRPGTIRVDFSTQSG